MTRKPRHAGGGFVNPSKLPKGPNGRALCRWCNEEVPKGRRTFCSDECVDQHVVRASPAGAARFLLKRDRGVCALCGLDCEWLRGLRAPYRVGHELGLTRDQFQIPTRMPLDEWRALMTELGFDWSQDRTRLWDVDHVVPVVEGGGERSFDDQSCPLHSVESEHAEAPEPPDPFSELYATLPECSDDDCAHKATRVDTLTDLVFCDDYESDLARDLPWAHIVREQEGRK